MKEKDITLKDSAQVGVERLRRSSLVWRPSLQEFPGPIHLLSPLSPNHQAAMGSYSDQTHLKLFSFFHVGASITILLKCRHPPSLAQSSYVMSLADAQIRQEVYSMASGSS
jgi:hypothetical protein